MENHPNFIPLLLVLLLAFLVPLVFSRLKSVPVVVGEILAGVIIGRSGFDLVGQETILGGGYSLGLIGNIGLAFLMFLAGMEIDFNRLFPNRRNSSKGQSKNVVGLAVIVYLLTLALAIPGGFVVNRLGLSGDPRLLAFILSATSLGVLLPVLKQRGMEHTLAGQVFFVTAILADFVTVLLLTIFIITLDRGINLEVFSIVLLFMFFFLFYRFTARLFRFQWMRSLFEELSHVTVQIKVRGAIAILMAFVVLASLLGVELILGAFLAGMVISLLNDPVDVDLTHKLEAFGYGFFIPVFFILVGIDLDLRSLIASPQNLILLPVLLLVALAVKILPALLFRRWLSWRETIAGAFLINTHLSLEIAVAVIGVRLGLLTSAANAAVILFAAITVLLMPTLFNIILPAKKASGKPVVILYGADHLGMQVADILRKHGDRIIMVDSDKTRLDRAQKAGIQVAYVDENDPDLCSVCKDEATAFLAITSSDNANLYLAQAAQREGIQRVVALVNDPTRLPEFQSLGITPFAAALYRPALLALMSRSSDIITLLTSPEDENDLREIVLKNPECSNKLLRDLGLPSSLLVLSVGRNGELIVPHGNTRIQEGDRLIIFGDKDDLEQASFWLEKR